MSDMKLHATEQQIAAARAQLQGNFAKAFMLPIATNAAVRTMLSEGRRLRDEIIYQYPILPLAVYVFQQLVASREFKLSGKPTAVARALDAIHNSRTMDVSTGYVYYGMEQFLKRRALDHLIVGRTTMALTQDHDGSWTHEYLDPTLLLYIGNTKGSKNRSITPVRPTEKVWQYHDGRLFAANEILIEHAMPIGSRHFIAPIVNVLPDATLAYLLTQHDTASLDGRKIRDVMIVQNGLLSPLEDAFKIHAALWNGANPQEVGVPVIEVNNPSGQPLENMITRFGLSNIPENFDRDAHNFKYVNEIAAALGLALRHFWNDERTTNKALEVVQEQRQQQKGPAAFVRTEQRLYNRSGLFDKMGSPRTNPIRFTFIEESDSSSQLERAEVLLKHAQALLATQRAIGTSIAPHSFVSWMQSLGNLPPEVELLDEDQLENTLHDESRDPLKPGETVEGSDAQPTTATPVGETGGSSGSGWDDYGGAKSAPIDYGEITVDMHGTVVDRRRKVYSLYTAVERDLGRAGEDVVEANDVLQFALDQVLLDLPSFKATLETNGVAADVLLQKLTQGIDLTGQEYEVLARVYATEGALP